MAHDAIAAHARDELGMSETLRARPIQAALASASSVAVGASMAFFIKEGLNKGLATDARH
jgi:hypothetical protein